MDCIVFRSLASFAAIAGLTALTLSVAAVPTRADFRRGDILLNNYDGSNVQQYRNGSLIQTFTGTGVLWEGASLTPNNNLVTTFRYQNSNHSGFSGVNVFDSAGTQAASFTTPDTAPGDISVFADGTLAVSNQAGSAIHLYSQSGTLLNTLVLPKGGDLFGSAIAHDNTLYVADTSARMIYHLDESGMVLNQINTDFGPADLVVTPNGSLFVADENNNRVVHLSTLGNPIGAFSVVSSGTAGIGLAPDAASIFVTGVSSSSVYHYDLNGNLLGSFAISNPQTPLFLTVVPNVTSVPEPSLLASFGLVSFGGFVLLSRRRRATHSKP